MAEDKVEVVPYDANWPARYRCERAAVLELLGDRIDAVEHIGSTALPGVAAKPTIDIMIGVSELKVDDAAIAALRKLGYDYLGEYNIPDRHFFRKGTPPTHHIHWVRIGDHFWDVQTLFRDYMREHIDEAHAYEELKRELAGKFHSDRAKYTSSKTDFVEGVLVKARKWRAESRPGLVVFDLEATCWEKGTEPKKQEIIEIGAVRLAPGSLEPLDRFARFIRPIEEPVLSDFCRNLTSIRQEDVDAAGEFKSVLREFAEWIGSKPVLLCSWGAYDLEQMKIDCGRRGVELPAPLKKYRDLQGLFAKERAAQACTMERALSILGIPLEGRHHRGIDDAINIAKIATAFLKGKDL